ncbi:BREX system P-loop protein BrxC [uncultured Cocleimonas sp.]|uniref:BREX system P-loop protein BrxC n=1 Tax=uncultured Cocleimonas sp. TaxID=1051587 RepID=UPI00261D2791|nr:BREX system P-loop protein BrxC [uncultured Cocleimonas sp.]
MQIKQLFDPTKGIDRAIEKVISYGTDAETRLKSEISEYVATDSIEEHFADLLSKMQLAMEQGGENEVGVWVSGFYGSGKSSFTKYLGLAFDDSVMVEGRPFIDHLKDRLTKAQTKSLLTTVSKRFPAAVIMLDLASEQVAGATMEDVATVMYYKVLQWAGYSRNLKVAAFERKLQKDGRYDEFLGLFKTHAEGEEWKSLQNDPFIVDGLIPVIAHEMYPQLFKTDSAFSTEASDIIRFENDRVAEMIDIARQHSGKENIIFIVDEVGQYVGSRDNLILNLDGLAKNLKNIGDGKVWMIGTAQQTLTEDNEKAALNSPQLFKLKDRFPIQINLESSDIKEICYRRLLGKSPEGADQLGQLFDKNGQALRHATKLEDARVYDADFDKESFVNLYPFLPAHFEVLLTLLGQLAKSTGGIGLRSAIKVIQDVLVEGANGKPIANENVGMLANTVTLYDALEKDIKRAFPTKHQAVGKVQSSNFFDSELHINIAKTVAVLEILTNLPVTRQNTMALMQSSITQTQDEASFNSAVDELINEATIPFSEQDGYLSFISEKLTEIQQARNEIGLKTIDLRRILSGALRDCLSPLPKVQVEGSLGVETGLKLQSPNGLPSGLAGERNPIQTLLEFVDPSEYDNNLAALVIDSREKANQNTIYLLGRKPPEVDHLLANIYRCEEINRRHRNDADKEVKEYCNAEVDRAQTKLEPELQRILKRSMQAGSFVFRGTNTAVDTFAQDLLESNKKHLKGVAERVYERYSEAPYRGQTILAEKFLKAGLSGATSETDPLGLVIKDSSGSFTIDENHKGLISIRDYIERNGTIDGKKISEDFNRPKFGWSIDTTRYMLAALLSAGEIKLKVAGRELTSVGQQAIDVFKTNKSFANVGISLRDDRPSNEMCALAAKRLGEVIADGNIIIPLEEEISKAAQKNFPVFQQQFGALGEKLNRLNVPGQARVEELQQSLRDVLFNDCSDATQRMGAEESPLHSNLKWAAEVKVSLDYGLEATLLELDAKCKGINNLPNSGVPGELKAELADDIEQLQQRLKLEDFHKYRADLSTMLGNIRIRVSDAASKMNQDVEQGLKNAQEELPRSPGWDELAVDERNNLLGQLEQFSCEVEQNLSGIQTLLNRDYEITTSLRALQQSVKDTAGKRRLQREQEKHDRQVQEKAAGKYNPKVLHRKLTVPKNIKKASSIDSVITELKDLKQELKNYDELDIRIELSDSE